MRSKLGEILREERERLGLTQRELAATAHVDRANISRYENGVMDIPHDVVCKAARAMGSHKLRAQTCFECQISSLTMPHLDLVDMHPMTVASVVVEELQEAVVALQGLRLANKRMASDLTTEDLLAMAEAGEQVIDLLAGINTLLGGWHEWYGFDVDRQAIAGYEKLFTKGYATRQSYDAWHYIA
jgi:transcriptional regulator with XRE-family HTH domain